MRCLSYLFLTLCIFVSSLNRGLIVKKATSLLKFKNRVFTSLEAKKTWTREEDNQNQETGFAYTVDLPRSAGKLCCFV